MHFVKPVIFCRMLAVRRLALALGQEAPRLFGQEAPRLAPRTFVTSTHLDRKTDQ